jgi:hypothetical protein
MHSLNKLIFFYTLFLSFAAGRLSAQVVYVDAAKGREEAKGTATDPLASLEKAVALAGSFTGNEPVTIKIHPGLYVLRQQAVLRTSRQSDDTLPYTLEAVVMPDDSAWQPGKMPVIRSVSPNNSEVQFVHAVGFLVARPNVRFRGLKFLGNAHPEVAYYYPSRGKMSRTGVNRVAVYFRRGKELGPDPGRPLGPRRGHPRRPFGILRL